MFSLTLIVVVYMLPTISAQAQSRVFVGAQGSDSNPCTFARPCRTFQHAHDVVAANGEIDVLDPAGYGAVTITKSISIQGHDFSGITTGPGVQGITIVAGPNDKIILRGLLIDGAGVGATGIAFFAGGSLAIENCVVRNFAGYGIAMVPTAATSVLMSNTLVADNANHGIYVRPSGSVGEVAVLFDRVRSYNNGGAGFGIFGDAIPAGSRVFAYAVDCIAQKNTDGFYALGNGANFISANFELFRSVGMANANSDAYADATIMFIGQSNLRVWKMGPTGGIDSYGDNYTGFSPSSTISKH
jgi:hypothetical protein